MVDHNNWLIDLLDDKVTNDAGMMSVGRVGRVASHGSVKATVTFQIKFCLLPLVFSDG